MATDLGVEVPSLLFEMDFPQIVTNANDSKNDFFLPGKYELVKDLFLT